MTTSPVAVLWMIDADAVDDADLARLRGWLSSGETARCQRFVRAQRLRQFVVGRVLARMALGRMLGVMPQAVVLEEQVAGAPLLVAPVFKGVTPAFSISHSGRWVACAVSVDTAVGLDIEVLDGGRDLAALAAQAFDAQELAQWKALRDFPHAQRVAGFYRLWSEKEARFKLGSDGVSIAIAHDELSVVICSARPLAAAPAIKVVTLAAL
jgi:4'-phosphopantetheinyl transferase